MAGKIMAGKIMHMTDDMQIDLIKTNLQANRQSAIQHLS